MLIQIISSILPLYLNILIGFIVGRKTNIETNSINTLIMYTFSPLTIFFGLASVDRNPDLIILPILLFCISSAICLFVYKLNFIFRNDKKMHNIIAFSSGSSNSGPFGLPIALILLDGQTFPVYIISVIGIIIFENTYGYYIATKDHFPLRYCVQKVMKLPATYAILSGIFCKIFDIQIPLLLTKFFQDIRVCFSVLGMVSLGIVLSQIKDLQLDLKFILVTSFSKYILWPLVMSTLIFIDLHYTHLFYQEKHIYKALFLISVLPISVSTMVVGNSLNYSTEKIAFAILINTIAGAFYIPIFAFIMNLNVI